MSQLAQAAASSTTSPASAISNAHDRRVRSQLALDALRVFAENDEGTAFALDERRERRIGRVLAAPSEDQNYLSFNLREGFKSLQRRVNIRRL